MSKYFGNEPLPYKDSRLPFMLPSKLTGMVLRIENRRSMQKNGVYAHAVMTPGGHSRFIAPYVIALDKRLEDQPETPKRDVFKDLARSPKAVELVGEGNGYLDALVSLAAYEDHIHVEDVSNIYNVNPDAVPAWSREGLVEIETLDSEPYIAVAALKTLFTQHFPGQGTILESETLFTYPEPSAE